MGHQGHNGQNLPKISMIATPLGNLGDLSERVIHALWNVDELWCEDTRHTQALLQAIQNQAIQNRASAPAMPRLRRFDQHTEEKELRVWLRAVQEKGQWIGVVSDAGTPGVSDPGGLLTRLISEYPSIKLEPIPGPSAVSALVSIAGFEENSFLFQGFFPREKRDLLKLLNELKDSGLSRNWIFFESPQRIEETWRVLEEWTRVEFEDLAQAPHFVFAKELTKLHETVWRGQGLEIFQRLQSELPDTRGEWCVAVILPKSYVIPKKIESDWVLALECLLLAKISPKMATQIVVQRFSIAKNLAYRQALELQKRLEQKNNSKKIDSDDSST
jgi:16S rRNA (cytidine1402-2'-O)-methyltransferase